MRTSGFTEWCLDGVRGWPTWGFMHSCRWDMTRHLPLRAAGVLPLTHSIPWHSPDKKRICHEACSPPFFLHGYFFSWECSCRSSFWKRPSTYEEEPHMKSIRGGDFTWELLLIKHWDQSHVALASSCQLLLCLWFLSFFLLKVNSV